MPVNVMIIRALLNFYLYYGDNFKIECPTGSGKMMNLFEVSKEIADRLSRIFLRDERGRRPVYGGTEQFQSDPTGATTFSSMNTFTVTTGRAWRGFIRQAGQGMWRKSSSSTACWMPSGYWKGEAGRVQGGRVRKAAHKHATLNLSLTNATPRRK
jgi:hypothetical protein